MTNTPEIKDGCMTQYNFLSKEDCDGIIDYFEKVNSFGMAYPRTEPKHMIDDTSIPLFDSPVVVRNFKAQWNMFHGLSDSIKNAFEFYTEKYSIIQRMDFQIYDIKIQKTETGQGFHIWHDDGGREPRATTFIIYLNDVEEGGETEMLYKPERIKPEVGKLFMFPANYMWTHRGNPPISNTKYILTGWIEYV
jgi:hypothetical protein